MSADFWAGYISGAVGIIIGNPLDVLKVKLQAGFSARPPIPTAATPTLVTVLPTAAARTPTATATARSYLRPFLTGTAAPVLGYGALNALLFVSYNRSETALNTLLGSQPPTTGSNLWTTWLAGAVGGLATWVVSTPTELVKCRAQIVSSSTPSSFSSSSASSFSPSSSSRSSVSGAASSWGITKQIFRAEGIRGLYFGGTVTALRDSVGYGFYFWSYELAGRWMASSGSPSVSEEKRTSGAARILLCGGIAGIITWASIFPLDVIKTRVQTQGLSLGNTVVGEREGLLPPRSDNSKIKLGAWEVARETYREGGIRPFFRGLAVCSVRAFVVNAVQWAVYEWIMMELGQGRRARAEPVKDSPAV